MTNYYSRVDNTLLLHVVFRLEDFTEGRKEIINPDQFIQCAALKMNKGKTFRPHRHIHRPVMHEAYHAQELWAVIKGMVMVILYDIDDTIITSLILFPGDASFTLRGGHNYRVMEDNSIVYEFKTGPYLGQEQDKAFIK